MRYSVAEKKSIQRKKSNNWLIDQAHENFYSAATNFFFQILTNANELVKLA